MWMNFRFVVAYWLKSRFWPHFYRPSGSNALAVQPYFLSSANECFHRCLSFCSEGTWVPLLSPTYQTWNLLPPPFLDIRHGTCSCLPATDIWWSSLETQNLPPLILTCGGHHWRAVQTCSLEDLPSPYRYWHLVATLNAGRTHPTGMLSCY